MNLANYYIVDATSGTILPAQECYLLRADDFPDDEEFAVMSDDDVSMFAIEYGQPLPNLIP
jgi:hypothetical protein